MEQEGVTGELGQRSPENLGHNMTSGFIIGDDRIAVIDSGACRAGAEHIHAAIRKVSDKPVRWVVNTGGQGQRWPGNACFHEQGATVTASAAASADMHERAAEQMIQAEQLIGKGFTDTAPAPILMTVPSARWRPPRGSTSPGLATWKTTTICAFTASMLCVSPRSFSRLSNRLLKGNHLQHEADGHG